MRNLSDNRTQRTGTKMDLHFDSQFRVTVLKYLSREYIFISQCKGRKGLRFLFVGKILNVKEMKERFRVLKA